MAKKLCAFGNPLLDIIANVDEDLLTKYDLKLDQVVEAEPWQLPLFQDILHFPVQYTPGGSTLNTCRVIQKHRPGCVTFVGCVGRDKFGQILESEATSVGVNLSCQYDDSVPNGVTAALVLGKYRTLCAYLGASVNFSLSHLLLPQNQTLLQQTDILYVEGFWVDHCFDSVLYLGRFAKENKKLFTMNVSGTYLCEKWVSRLEQMMELSGIIFGNQEEFRALADGLGLGKTDIEEIALTFSQIGEKASFQNSSSSKEQPFCCSNAITFESRVVVVTNNALPVMVASQGRILSFPVPVVAEEEIADTIGAGDSFVGGFFAYYMEGRSLEECVNFGIQEAVECIKKTGA